MKPYRSLIAVALAAAPAHADPDDATDEHAAESDPPSKHEPTGTFAVGAGYSTDEGFIATAKIAQPDLFRSGQGLALSAEISQIRESFVLQHSLPLGPGLQLRSELFATEHKYPGFDRQGIGGAMTLVKRLGPATTVYARYRIEQVDVSLDTASRMATAPNLGDGLIASLGAGIAYDTRDHKGLHGDRLALFAESADPRLGSDYQLVRVTGSADHAQPLGPFTLRLHGGASYVHSDDPMGVPLSERLFHDGNVDVRGYRIGSIGSQLGDNAELLGRAELEMPLIPKLGIGVAGFADAGLRYNTDASFGSTGSLLYRSVGASLIWRSPIGVLHFDWAVPLDAKDKSLAFSFGIGM